MQEYFAIVGQRRTNKIEYKVLGTGFFISSNGLFLTAGHVFKNHEIDISLFLICFPNASKNVELITIKKYYHSAKELYNDEHRNLNAPRYRGQFQCGPEYFDFAVGKVDLKNTPFYVLKRKRPFEWEKLKMPCFNIKEVECPLRRFQLENNQVNSRFIEFNIRDLSIKDRLRLARIPFLYDDMVFENIDLYNNCMEVYGGGEKGNSGAPVLDSNEFVVGIYVAGTTFNDLKAIHLSRYILKKSRYFLKLLNRPCN
jgi:hypothetical protein